VVQKKVKILFIYEWLVKAGAQTYLFELIKAINKDKFDVSVLCGQKSPDPFASPKEYYYFEIKNLGVKMFPYLGTSSNPPLPIHKKFWKKFLNISSRKLKLSVSKYLVKKDEFQDKINELVLSQDHVVVIDFYTYNSLKTIIDKVLKPEVHILCDTFQYKDDIFKYFDKTREYTFFYYNTGILPALKKSFNSDSTFQHLPLILNTESLKIIPLKKINKNEEINIAVFTRIAPNKRLEYFILAFHLLCNKYSDLKFRLKIFGFIQSNSYYESILGMIAFYRLEEFIDFEGHSEHMAESILQKNIAIAWHIHSTSSPGYAGIEVAATGLPCLYYEAGNLNDNDHSPLKKFKRIDLFAEETVKLIEDEGLYNDYSVKQRNYIINHFDIENYISMLEKYWSK